MNNRNKRATRVIVASGSLLAIIFIAIPWVDEYLRLRRDAAEFTELQARLPEAQRRKQRLDRIEVKLTRDLESLRARSIDPTETESIRQTLIEFVRQSGGRLRRLDVSNGVRRVWAIEGDDPRMELMPPNGEESRFVLHTQLIELQADGSLESIRQILHNVVRQGWLMTTRGLTMAPTGNSDSPVKLELQLVLYGLSPHQRESEEEFAATQRSRSLAAL